MNAAPKIKQILADVSGYDLIDITDESILTLDLDLDSLDIVHLAQELESEFGVGIPDTDITATMTVRDLVETINKLI